MLSSHKVYFIIYIVDWFAIYSGNRHSIRIFGPFESAIYWPFSFVETKQPQIKKKLSVFFSVFCCCFRNWWFQSVYVIMLVLFATLQIRSKTNKLIWGAHQACIPSYRDLYVHGVHSVHRIHVLRFDWNRVKKNTVSPLWNDTYTDACMPHVWGRMSKMAWNKNQIHSGAVWLWMVSKIAVPWIVVALAALLLCTAQNSSAQH